MAHLLSKKNNISKKPAGINTDIAGSIQVDNQLREFFINNYQLFIALICLLVMAGSLFWFFLPQYQKTLAEANDNYQQAQQDLLDKQKYQASLIQLNDFYKRIDQKTRNKVIDILPAKLDRENLLAEIEAICLANSLLIKSSDVVVGEDNAPTASSTVNVASLNSQLRSATIKLELQGKDYQSFKSLLKTVENNLHLMDIQRLDYSPGKNQIVLEIQVYYLSN
jgi:plastocyanin domain-containing protein